MSYYFNIHSKIPPNTPVHRMLLAAELVVFPPRLHLCLNNNLDVFAKRKGYVGNK